MNQLDRQQAFQIKDLLRDNLRGAIMFSNEFCLGCHCDRGIDEPVTEYHTRLLLQATRWYGDHLQGQIPLIILSNNPAAYNANMDAGLSALDMGKYLQRYYPAAADVHEVYTSLREAALEHNQQREHGWSTERGFLSPILFFSCLSFLPCLLAFFFGAWSAV